MEDLQGLLEKINRDGVEKAEAAAKEILAAAEARAAAMVAEAEAEAARRIKTAEAESEAFKVRAEATVKQAARDVVLSVKDALVAQLESLLVKSVDRALSDEAVVSELVAVAVRELAESGEVSAPAKLAASLKAKLAANGGFTVVTDDTLGSGFAVRVDNGRVEHAFTVEAVAGELAKRLRPELAKLLN